MVNHELNGNISPRRRRRGRLLEILDSTCQKTLSMDSELLVNSLPPTSRNPLRRRKLFENARLKPSSTLKRKNNFELVGCTTKRENQSSLDASSPTNSLSSEKLPDQRIRSRITVNVTSNY
jgi:hypothetical protein